MSAGKFLLWAAMSFSVMSCSSNPVSISADVVTDIDYVKPGDRVPLTVELVNPRGSNIVIGGAYSALNSSEIRQLMELPFLTLLDSTGCPFGQTGAALGLKRHCENDIEIFPVNPGESEQFAYLYLELSEDAPQGTVIRLGDLTLNMYDQNSYRLPDLHVDRDIVRIVSHPSPTLPLPQIQTTNPKAGAASLNMAMEIGYPERVNAGDTIYLHVTLINHGNEPVLIPYFQMNIGRLANIRCISAEHCQATSLTPGQSLEVEFALESEKLVLQPEILEVKAPYMLATDTLGRKAYIYGNPIRVVMDHYTHLPTLRRRAAAH